MMWRCAESGRPREKSEAMGPAAIFFFWVVQPAAGRNSGLLGALVQAPVRKLRGQEAAAGMMYRGVEAEVRAPRKESERGANRKHIPPVPHAEGNLHNKGCRAVPAMI